MVQAPIHVPPWQTSAASVRGRGHEVAGLPNQDSVAVLWDDSARLLCAVVSDGAGTAARSGEGASLCTSLLSRHLLQATQPWREHETGLAEVRAAFEHGVRAVRQAMADLGGELSAFHCTVAALVCTPQASFIAQIGDSAALVTRFQRPVRSGGLIDFFPAGGWSLRLAGRGEYANETSFVTEPDWQEKLRVERLANDTDAVLLMTDGAMDVVMQRGQVFRGFLSNLIARLLTTDARRERDEVMAQWLGDPRTYSVTGDDKTLFVAIRHGASEWAGMPFFAGEGEVPGAPEPASERAAEACARAVAGQADSPAASHRTPAQRIIDLCLLGGLLLALAVLLVIALRELWR